MQNWPGELPEWFPLRNQIIHITLSGLLLPSRHNNCIHVCRWWQSFNHVTCRTAKSSCVIARNSGLRGMRPTHHSNYLNESESPTYSSSCCVSVCFFLPLSPNPWLKLFVCLSMLVLLLCFFFVSFLSHWENTSRLLNYRSQVACQQQKWFNTPLKIHLAVFTMNIIEAASCGPPKSKRTGELLHSCFRTTGRSVEPFTSFLLLYICFSILIVIRRRI